jgi:hypothetical protein
MWRDPTPHTTPPPHRRLLLFPSSFSSSSFFFFLLLFFCFSFFFLLLLLFFFFFFLLRNAEVIANGSSPRKRTTHEEINGSPLPPNQCCLPIFPVRRESFAPDSARGNTDRGEGGALIRLSLRGVYTGSTQLFSNIDRGRGERKRRKRRGKKKKKKEEEKEEEKRRRKKKKEKEERKTRRAKAREGKSAKRIRVPHQGSNALRDGTNNQSLVFLGAGAAQAHDPVRLSSSEESSENRGERERAPERHLPTPLAAFRDHRCARKQQGENTRLRAAVRKTGAGACA